MLSKEAVRISNDLLTIAHTAESSFHFCIYGIEGAIRSL